MKYIYSFTKLVIKKNIHCKKIKRALKHFLLNLTLLEQTPPIHDFFMGNIDQQKLVNWSIPAGHLNTK